MSTATTASGATTTSGATEDTGEIDPARACGIEIVHIDTNNMFGCGCGDCDVFYENIDDATREALLAACDCLCSVSGCGFPTTGEVGGEDGGDGEAGGTSAGGSGSDSGAGSATATSTTGPG